MPKFIPPATRWLPVLPCFFLLSATVKGDDAPATSQVTNGPSVADVLALSPFGIGSDYHSSLVLPKWMPQMTAIGLHVLRTGDNAKDMDYLDGLKVKYGVILYGVPPGDTLDAPGSLPVKDLTTWSAYVTNRMKEANGRALYWELWNEPPNGIGPGQTAADYAKLLISTYDTARAVDPKAVVAMEAKSVHVNWLYQTIKAGGKDHFDCIILHPYEVLGTAMDHAGAEPVFMSIAPTVRKMLADQDPAKVNVPIIFTELGFDSSKGLALQGNAIVKTYAMGIAQGITCIQWFEGMDGDSGPMGLLQGDLTPRPAYTAMAQMIKHLGQHPAYLGWVLLNNKDYGFVFQGDTGKVLVTWARKGTTDDVDFGQPVSIVDPLTGNATQSQTTTLTDNPIIVDGPSANMVKLAQDHKGKPFPWDGDYTNAQSISVTYGTTNVEKGLHTQSAESIASDVVTYGGGSRAGGIPGGTVFMVDPNFLSYTSTPIEISITVRRNAANDNAGFKLVYESTNGYKDCGWYTVPDNKEWHTVTYKITDEQFVSMWGYNFSLDSDGNQYNKYDIQSVTVKKLPQ
ncbi:MAG: hypothetical protein LV479_04765 [Methylacidiphilales bacterium]|nr:hypothetical protein [Candidatus Methylacidiphilales bacterium]